jgi:hypothetical protein
MTGKEYSKGNVADAGLSGWRHFKDSTLKSIAPLFLLIALMSQWYISYYIEDYYAHKPMQKGLNLDDIKSHALMLSDRTIMGFNIAALENLITFNCKK